MSKTSTAESRTARLHRVAKLRGHRLTHQQARWVLEVIDLESAMAQTDGDHDPGRIIGGMTPYDAAERARQVRGWLYDEMGLGAASDALGDLSKFAVEMSR